jgi:hypothetical protein
LRLRLSTIRERPERRWVDANFRDDGHEILRLTKFRDRERGKSRDSGEARMLHERRTASLDAHV